mgnify:FL=1
MKKREICRVENGFRKWKKGKVGGGEDVRTLIEGGKRKAKKKGNRGAVPKHCQGLKEDVCDSVEGSDESEDVDAPRRRREARFTAEQTVSRFDRGRRKRERFGEKLDRVFGKDALF